MGQKDKALAEARILDEAKKQPGRLGGKNNRDWLRDNVSKGDSGGYEARGSMLGHGADVEELWQYAERRKLTSSTLRNTLMAAVKLRKTTGIGMKEAVSKILKDAQQEGLFEALKNIRNGDTPGSGPDTERNGVQQSKAFWGKLQELAASYIEDRLADSPESEKKELLGEFETNMKIAADELFGRITSKKRQGRESEVASLNAQIRMACERIGISPPHNGRFDFNRAKKQYRAQSSILHPDKNKDPNVVQQYNDLQRAWQIVVRWWELNGRNYKK